MTDYIDRNALIDYICGHECGCYRKQCGYSKEKDGADCCERVRIIEEFEGAEAKNANKWISVSDRLPRYNRDVLIYTPDMAIPILIGNCEGYYGEDDNEWREGWRFYIGGSGTRNVTHWMPLPEPPQDK